ncbi:MAG: hypothetical protein Q9208_002525 [Pyrenodesmia sp. 3 TL-2023]
MIVGYILANVLGFFFAVALFRTEGLPKVLHGTAGLCIEAWIQPLLRQRIQVASIVMLARLDFGVSARGMGDSTAKIIRAVSLLTLLPLVYVNLLPHLLHGSKTLEQQSKSNRIAKEHLRFGQFSLCWLLSMYPFYSTIIDDFGPSLIGDGPDKVISDDTWSIISMMCTANLKPISKKELFVMLILGMAGSLFVYIYVLIKVTWLALQRHHEHLRLVRWIHVHGVIVGQKISIVFLVVLPAFAVGQIWTIFRLRRFQADIAKNTG